ncbi:MAG: ABC transporter substrate-binding protein, partial [Chloroflexota bacterium]
MRLWYRSRWLIFAVLASVAVVGLAACGGEEEPTATPEPAATNTPSPDPDPTDTPEPGATDTPAPTATPFETSTPRPTSDPGEGLEGSVTMAVPEVLPVGGYRMQVAYDSSTLPPGTTDLLFIRDPETGNELGEFIAEDFEFSEGGSVLDITIRQGVEWNVPVQLRDEFPDGFPESSGGDGPGVVDAEDIAWWFNNANALLNPESTDPDGGDLAAYFGENEAEVIDRWTVRLTLEEPTFTGIPLSEMGAGGAHGWHVSRDYFYAMGGDENEEEAIDAMMPYHVGTGPYAQSSWTADEEGCVEAVPDHWYYDNDRVQEFCLRQVGESSTQLAMLQSGEIDLAQIDFSLVENAEQDENLHYIRTQGDEAYVGASMIWAGNLWETEHAVSGDPLNPWESAAYEEDLPWIGAPEEYNDELPYTDDDNPSGVSDMEQARLVRWAVNYALDSELMVDELTGGLGDTLAIEYMGPHFPGWEPSNTVNKDQIDGILEEYGWEDHPTYDVDSPAADEEFDWDSPHDPARSQQL